MNFAELLPAFALGVLIGGVGGIVLGFVWYERKCGLLSDSSGKRAAAIRFELDDVFEGNAQTHGALRRMLGAGQDAFQGRTQMADLIRQVDKPQLVIHRIDTWLAVTGGAPPERVKAGAGARYFV